MRHWLINALLGKSNNQGKKNEAPKSDYKKRIEGTLSGDIVDNKISKEASDTSKESYGSKFASSSFARIKKSAKGLTKRDLEPHFSVTKISPVNFQLHNFSTKKTSYHNTQGISELLYKLNPSTSIEAYQKELQERPQYVPFTITANALTKKASAEGAEEFHPWDMVEVNGHNYIVRHLEKESEEEEIVEKEASLKVKADMSLEEFEAMTEQKDEGRVRQWVEQKARFLNEPDVDPKDWEKISIRDVYDWLHARGLLEEIQKETSLTLPRDIPYNYALAYDDVAGKSFVFSTSKEELLKKAEELVEEDPLLEPEILDLQPETSIEGTVEEPTTDELARGDILEDMFDGNFNPVMSKKLPTPNLIKAYESWVADGKPEGKLYADEIVRKAYKMSNAIDKTAGAAGDVAEGSNVHYMQGSKWFEGKVLDVAKSEVSVYDKTRKKLVKVHPSKVHPVRIHASLNVPMNGIPKNFRSTVASQMIEAEVQDKDIEEFALEKFANYLEEHPETKQVIEDLAKAYYESKRVSDFMADALEAEGNVEEAKEVRANADPKKYFEKLHGHSGTTQEDSSH
jgi:hypothetical protein